MKTKRAKDIISQISTYNINLNALLFQEIIESFKWEHTYCGYSIKEVNKSLSIDREGATSAAILHFEEDEPVQFPAKFISDIGEKAALSVLHHKDRVLKVFPVASDDIYLLRVAISDLSRNFLKQLNFAFNDAKLSDIIFTTGVCLRGEKCYYECYFLPAQLVITLKELEDSLKKIPGVSKVTLRQVE